SSRRWTVSPRPGAQSSRKRFVPPWRGSPRLRSRTVVALGGNAIVRAGQQGTAEEQEASVAASCAQIATMLDAGYDVVLTHGNGPQLGNLLIKNELARGVVPAMPLDWCVAQTQATVGYMIQQSLGCELERRGTR